MHWLRLPLGVQKGRTRWKNQPNDVIEAEPSSLITRLGTGTTIGQDVVRPIAVAEAYSKSVSKVYVKLMFCLAETGLRATLKEIELFTRRLPKLK